MHDNFEYLFRKKGELVTVKMSYCNDESFQRWGIVVTSLVIVEMGYCRDEVSVVISLVIVELVYCSDQTCHCRQGLL